MATITKIFKYIDDIANLAPQFKCDSPVKTLEPFFRPQKERVKKLIGAETYTMLEAYIESQNTTQPGAVDEIKAEASENMQMALANLLAIPYFIFEAKERNNTDSGLYRYQENQQIDTYLEFAWSALNSLFDFLDANTDTFTDYVNTRNYKLRSEMFLKNASDFTRYYGAVKSSYFFNNTLYIQEEELSKIKSRISNYPTMPTTETEWLVGKALVYLILSKACIQLDYTELPTSIRSKVVSEVTTKKGNETDVKQALSGAFSIEADSYLEKIEFEVNKAANSGTYTAVEDTLTEDDNFVMPC